MQNDKEVNELCKCGHPYDSHLPPDYREAMCTNLYCICKKFVAKPTPASPDAVKELAKEIFDEIEKHKCLVSDYVEFRVSPQTTTWYQVLKAKYLQEKGQTNG